MKKERGEEDMQAAGGPRQLAETGIARAETLGPDGGQRTWKPGPGGAEGPTDAKESAHNLFPSHTAGSQNDFGGGLRAGRCRLAGRLRLRGDDLPRSSSGGLLRERSLFDA